MPPGRFKRPTEAEPHVLQWVGRGNLRKPWFSPSSVRVMCQFSLEPIHYVLHVLHPNLKSTAEGS